MRTETKKAFDNILDTMTGMDGGVSFVKFKCLVEQMDDMANNGNKPAEEIILLVKRFSKLIDVANYD